MGNRLRSCALIAILALAGCRCPVPCPPPPPEPSQPSPEAKPDEAPPGVEQATYAAMDNAAQACAVLGYLKCEEGKDPVACAESIRKLVKLGTFEVGNVLCIRTSRTIERVRTCDVECPAP